MEDKDLALTLIAGSAAALVCLLELKKVDPGEEGFLRLCDATEGYWRLNLQRFFESLNDIPKEWYLDCFLTECRKAAVYSYQQIYSQKKVLND
jgi:hypothetical protein